jgi:hypothetical protein
MPQKRVTIEDFWLHMAARALREWPPVPDYVIVPDHIVTTAAAQTAAKAPGHPEVKDMSLPKEIKQLIAMAAQGRGSIPQPKMRTHKKTPINPQHPEAVEKAKGAAVAVFAWTDGPIGKEIRDEMISAGTDAVPLHAWRVCITQKPGVLQVRRDANPSLRQFDVTRADVKTPDELIKAVGPEIVIAIAHDIAHDRIFVEMGSHLRQLTSGG